MILALLGCGGSSSNSELSSTADNSRGTLESPKLDPAWLAIIENPGEPGVDYEPNQIMVSYRKDLTPADLSRFALQAGQSVAASLPNAILREKKYYEPLTDAVAAAHNLTIGQQVYVGELHFAAFLLPDGVDAEQVLAAIRTQFADVIEWATYDRIIHPTYEVDDPWFNQSSPNGGGNMFSHPQWGQQRIGCKQAWDYTLGDAAVRVAVVDSGANLGHEELGQVLNPAVHFPGEKLNVSSGNPNNWNNDISDGNGHGSFICGIVGATGENNRTMVGIAPRCEIVAIKVAGSGGTAWTTSMAAGCTLAMQLGVRSVNLSFGSKDPNALLADMVNTLFNGPNGGTLLAVSADNDGDDGTGHLPSYPAAYVNAFSVGSTDRFDARSDFSNFDQTVDIAAPGEWLRSTYAGASNAYSGPQQGNGFGTSYSSPMVAAVAGLMLTLNPALTVQELRQIMLTTGAPTTGFPEHTELPRLDAAAAVAASGGVVLKTPKLQQLVHSGSFTVTAEFVGLAPNQIEARLNGASIGTRTAAPWDFQIDTSATNFGVAKLEFIARNGGVEESRSEADILIDNYPTGTFPLLEGFDTANRNILGYDARALVGEVLVSGAGPLYQQSPKPSADAFAANGPAAWAITGGDKHAGTSAMRVSDGAGGYGSFEIDTLVTRRLNLAAGSTLVFHHHHNIEDGGSDFDRAWVLVTQDEGRTFAPAKLRTSGAPAFWSGNQAAWTKAEVDLSDFTGEAHVVLCLQSDADVAGEAPGAAGWWVDTFIFATNYNETVPTIGGVNVAQYSVYGGIPAKPSLNVTIQQPVNVASARFILDCEPFGTLELAPMGNDQLIPVSSAPFNGSVPLPTNAPNQLAYLKVLYYDSNLAGGPEVVVPIYLFNKLGDVNADGKVDAADMAAFDGKIGLTSADPGYVPFFDSDLDGTITELDAAAVGYFWQP